MNVLATLILLCVFTQMSDLPSGGSLVALAGGDGGWQKSAQETGNATETSAANDTVHSDGIVDKSDWQNFSDSESVMPNPQARSTRSGITTPFSALGGRPNDLPNFQIVDDKLLRGGQPTATGLGALKQAGVKTIINLRNEDIPVEREKNVVQLLGLRYVNIPIAIMSAPTKEDIEQFLAVVNNAGNQPCYVHCQLGEDRTGTMVGIYRIDHGWGANRAFKEMVSHGFKPMLANMTQTLFEFAASRGCRDKPPSSEIVIQDLKKQFSKIKRAIGD
ncbi:MAG TPA: tyrosine-protein phosphatase [Candidatus Obscuribacterales bacterium]